MDVLIVHVQLDVSEIVPKNVSQKQYKAAAILPVFRPVSLPVGSHYTLHHIEVLFLLVTKLIVTVDFYRIHIQIIGKTCEKSSRSPFLIDLFLIQCVTLQLSGRWIVLELVAVEQFSDGFVIVERCSGVQKILQVLFLLYDCRFENIQFIGMK